ncbi:MAG: hypothetical protein JSW11_07575 [Candidatus Heimdallarchaeota archaeon]|nr:MAG: hypothetical protein JSW11_07575 [Candidatus Heimdallarchaeota archaeon]
MDSDIQTVMEIIFNLFYLTFIWIVVVLMTIKIGKIVPEERSIVQRFLLAFFLLALGDTGHVGFRILAYISGGLETNSTLVGLGALSTSITITFFYMILLDIWRIQFPKDKDLFYYGLMLIGFTRFIIMIFPQNEWGNLIAPYDWALIRNVPLTIIGLATAFLMLRDGFKYHDPRYKNFGYCIVISFAFYIPVILSVQTFPLIGMLMIPKTMAYMVLAFLAYKFYYQTEIR